MGALSCRSYEGWKVNCRQVNEACSSKEDRLCSSIIGPYYFAIKRSYASWNCASWCYARRSNITSREAWRVVVIRVRAEGLEGGEANIIVDSGVSGAVIITTGFGRGRPVCNGFISGAGGCRTRSRGGSYRMNSAILVVRAHPLDGAGD